MASLLYQTIEQISRKSTLNGGDRRGIGRRDDRCRAESFNRPRKNSAQSSIQTPGKLTCSPCVTYSEVIDPKRNSRWRKAKRIDPKTPYGQRVLIPNRPTCSGRIAAQTAKNKSSSRGARGERDTIYNEYNAASANW